MNKYTILFTFVLTQDLDSTRRESEPYLTKILPFTPRHTSFLTGIPLDPLDLSKKSEKLATKKTPGEINSESTRTLKKNQKDAAKKPVQNGTVNVAKNPKDTKANYAVIEEILGTGNPEKICILTLSNR